MTSATEPSDFGTTEWPSPDVTLHRLPGALGDPTILHDLLAGRYVRTTRSYHPDELAKMSPLDREMLGDSFGGSGTVIEVLPVAPLLERIPWAFRGDEWQAVAVLAVDWGYSWMLTRNTSIDIWCEDPTQHRSQRS